MSEKSNDTASVVNTSTIEGFDTDNEGDEDIHYCKKCRIMFTSLEEYLQHKVKHDNYKVTFSRSGHDRRMVVPKLIQKQTADTSVAENEDNQTTTEGSEKENTSTKKKKRGRKRKIKGEALDINKELVITDKPAYYCPKCDIKFNREATLRRHVEYVHDSTGDYTTNVGEEDGEGGEVEANIGRVIKNDETEEDSVEDPDYKQKKSTSIPTADTNNERRFECHICQNRFKDLNVLKCHLLTHSNKRDFPCGVEGCVFAFKTKGSLKRHMRRHTGERPFSCLKCGRSFTESGALTRHMKSRIPCTSKSDNDLPRYGKRWSFVTSQTSSEECVTTVDGKEACELEEGEILPGEVAAMDAENSEIVEAGQTASSSEVEPVQEKETVPEVQEEVSTVCKVCKQDMTSVEGLRVHLRTHLADATFHCVMCHYVTESRADLSNHMWSLHQSQIKGAEQIEPVYHLSRTPDDSLDKEMQTHNAKIAIRQMLQLPAADTSTTGSTDTTGDAENHVFRCSVCNKVFRANSNLRLHMRSHIGDRPHKCPHCDKCFVTKDTLCKHMSVHSEERQYKCGECGKLFKRISHVREHLKIHSSDRPFPCELCDKSFKTGNAMKVHMRTHTNVMPYVCPYCRRHFREKGSLNRHKRMHTGEKPYVCKLCGKSFSEHGTLNRHLKAKVPCSRQVNTEDQPEKPKRTRSTSYTNVLAEYVEVPSSHQENVEDQPAEKPKRTRRSSYTNVLAEFVEVPSSRERNAADQPERPKRTRRSSYTNVLAEFVAVPCAQQQNVEEQEEPRSGTSYSNVLAEFSTLADTQQYITTNEVVRAHQQVESQTEYVVLHTDLRDDNLHNVEIVTEAAVDTTMLEGVQVTDDYIVVTDSDQGMKILDSKTGAMIAMMPLSQLADGDNQLINMTSENEIEAVAMAPSSTLDLSDSIVEQAMMVANVEEQVETTETVQSIVDGDITGIVTEEMIITSEADTNLIESSAQ
ncbi:transcription factor E4F1-like [Argopecten irradians]|uniref:transcription factor E4F1-like n=1 Tax=Argopecten irradians TaxID=31199 RepID=UPI00371F1B44